MTCQSCGMPCQGSFCKVCKRNRERGWLASDDIGPDRRPLRCPDCGHEFSAIVSCACPECGSDDVQEAASIGGDA